MVNEFNNNEESFKLDENWFKKSLQLNRLITFASHEEELVKVLIEQAIRCAKESGQSIGVSIAAAFDFLISIEYYTKITNNGWLYCPFDEKPLLVYPFTNACPRCVLQNRFHYHKSNKPESGAIGAATSRLLCGFFKVLFSHYEKRIKIYRGYEPVDVIFYDAQNTTALLAEVKATPLLTLPLAVTSEQQNITQSDGGIIVRPHSDAENSAISSSVFNFLIPQPITNRHYLK